MLTEPMIPGAIFFVTGIASFFLYERLVKRQYQVARRSMGGGRATSWLRVGSSRHICDALLDARQGVFPMDRRDAILDQRG